jgi:CRISPR type III-A-associated RAMP protein Csm4
MSKVKFYSLDFISHFTKIDSIKISGSTLAGALELYPNMGDLIINCFKNGHIIFSDPYPIIDGNPMVAFPRLPLKIKEHDKIKDRKSIKKEITFDTLRKIFKQYNEKGFVILDENQELIKGKEERYKNSFDDEIGVNIYREPITRDGKIIYTDVFTKEYDSSGTLTINRDGTKTGILMWLGVKIDDDCTKLEKVIDSSLSLLSDLGISGRRSIGKGFFKIKKYEIKENFGFEGEGYYYLLSKFIPSEEEIEKIDFEKSTYSFEILSGLDKNGIPLGIYRYILPGSILYLKGDVKGISITFEKYGRIIPFFGLFKRVM